MVTRKLLLLLKPGLAIFNKNNQTTEVDNPTEVIWPSKLLVKNCFKNWES